MNPVADLGGGGSRGAKEPITTKVLSIILIVYLHSRASV